ncbi:class I SAM-dependent methyltransferase [candidate division KSB1 bacterium]|nr:class I SAM-dependent methyltransferase [candidate division KSB1 bacterium]
MQKRNPQKTGTPSESRSTPHRLSSDLAWLWPMWGDHASDYGRYADHAIGLIRRHAQRPVATLLDISCGGGKNAWNFKRHFKVTGVDISPTMLDQTRRLNPDCDFVQADMRTFDLGKRFDAVLMDDGISYMTSRADLSAALATAFHHLEPGGVMILTPDVTTETFCQNQTTCTPAEEKYKPTGIEVVFVENNYDPDPTDEHYETTILYLIRENGVLRVETDRFILGLFSLDTWIEMFSDTGFLVQRQAFRDDGVDYTTFICVKPA